MTRRAVRQNIVRRLRRSLMGPGTDNESTHMLPTVQYITGIIYPFILESKAFADDDSGVGGEVLDEDEETHSDSHLPRTMGLSTLVDAGSLTDSGVTVTISGAIYMQEGKTWRRIPISENGAHIDLTNEITGISFGDEKSSKEMPLKDLPGTIGQDLEEFSLVWESSKFNDPKSDKDRWYLSVFLVNKRRCISCQRASNSLYQTYIKVSTGGNGAIVAREVRIPRKDEDMQSLSLLYNDRHELGVGHLCSVNWDPGNDSDALIGSLPADTMDECGPLSLIPTGNVDETSGRCRTVETTFFPEYHSHELDFKVGSDEGPIALGMYRLSDEEYLEGGEGGKSENIRLLEMLASLYEEWIVETFSDSESKGHAGHKTAFGHNRKDCEVSLSRIRKGIEVLSGNDEAYAAFCLMNRAIWLQYINKEASKKGKRPYPTDHRDHSGSWRPFQLGFILQCIPSVFDDRHEDRGLLDLLWIPTGGGKTEAYLGLVAFVMFLNRIQKKASDRDGVEVMMRYTMRLLTLQQFQRAARLILACEYIRLCDGYSSIEGCKPFSLGLYVGQSMTPNHVKTKHRNAPYDNDYDLYEKLYRMNAEQYRDFENCRGTAEYAISSWKRTGKPPEKQNPVQILSCPWCGNEMAPGDFRIVSRSGKWMFETHCSSPKCRFHKYPMPIQTVDECIYEEPPSLLIGTVDKFAQLPFNERMGSLFGWRDGEVVGSPPSLIIQDELHLINGPLGSMVGLYEATIDLLSTRGTKAPGRLSLDSIDADDTGVTWDKRPKIVASTATIRNARAQCRQLYDRKVARFPAAGTSIADSFFVRDSSENANDKAYVGILCAGVAMKSSLKRCVSDITNLVSVEKTRRKTEEYDPYWTTVSFFNSVRELGGAVTLLRDDVRNAVAEKRPSMMMERSIGELHGGLSSTDLPNVLRRMSVTADGEDPYDVICCTNMFSVGVDVDRLGLMVVNCQPNATTEYLQATGRVGRKGDGLVLSLFNQARPRDQSHFEDFYDYHSRIQLHVESMTVTPYSEGCLDRALHAQYVAMMRHMFSRGDLPDLRRNTECKNYSRSHRNHEDSLLFMRYLIQRARTVTASESSRRNLARRLLLFQEEWLRRLDEAEVVLKGKGKKIDFYYQQKSSRQYYTARLLEMDVASRWLEDSFLWRMGFVNKPILTPNSLRNVEEEVDFVFLEARR